MYSLKITLWIALVCCLTLEIVKADSKESTKEKTLKSEASEIEDSKSKPEKRDSQKHEGLMNENIPQQNQQQQFTNDEPFRPIYRPEYTQQYNAAPKGQQYLSQAIVPQAETYYDKPQFTNSIRYVAPSHTDGGVGFGVASNPKQMSARTGVPLVGSYISSIGGVRYASDSYRGPLNSVVHQQRKQQPKAQLAVQKQATKVAPSIPKAKGLQNNLAYAEPVTSFSFDRLPKGSQQPQQQQQRLILQPLHQQHQPYLHFYNPHPNSHAHPHPHLLQHQSLHQQQINARVIPQQQHIQYIIAIPLSHVRQLQQQLAESASTQPLPSLRHEMPHSTSKSEIPVAAPPIIGPVARDHYGSYRPVHYTTNHQAQHVTPSAQNYNNQEPQYTTQYIQVPASVLNAAVQAAHAYQNRQHEQEQHKPAFQQSQPQYAYNTYQHRQSPEQEQEKQTQHHAPVYVHLVQEQPQTQKPLQEAIIHVGGAKPSAKSTPTKTYNGNTQIPATSTPTSITPLKAPLVNSLVSPTNSADAAPIVHFNPIYVQGPPPEQQSLFGTLNYHRFATGGGFHGTTPVPLIRLSATPSQSYYTSLPQQQPHQFHTGSEQKAIYSGLTTEQIPNVAAGLPYFTHPGGVHYGTHLYHPSPAFYASPSIQSKASETVNSSLVSNQHQQPE